MILLINLIRNNGINVSKLSKKTNITYSYTCLLLNILNKNNIVYFEKANRSKYIYLTEKGIYITELILKLREVLKNGKNES